MRSPSRIKVVVRRTWLIGRTSRRPALLLDFAAGNKPLDPGLPPGFVVDADLAFVPGAVALKVLLKERHATPEAMTTIGAAFASYGEALAKNPWIELVPVAVRDVRLEHDGDAWSVRDESGAVLPMTSRFRRGWQWLAIGGGGPLTITGEFDGERLEAFGAIVDGRFVAVTGSNNPHQQKASIAMPVAVPLLIEATASAVVGVDRKPPPSPGVDDPIAAVLAGLDETEAPARLLAIAAASSLYGRVGRKPAIDPAPAPSLVRPTTGPRPIRLRRIDFGRSSRVNTLRLAHDGLRDSGRFTSVIARFCSISVGSSAWKTEESARSTLKLLTLHGPSRAPPRNPS